MALFPDAEITLLFEAPGHLVPGTRLEGSVIIRAPKPIPRAQRLDVLFRTTASVSYEGGNQYTDNARDIFVVPIHIPIDVTAPLSAGEHVYPFAFDVPPWLPPALLGNDFAVRHQVEVRLDVDWAFDPHKVFSAQVVPVPTEARTEPVVMRSPPGWHPSLVFDVTLDRAVIVAGESVTGVIALRGGAEVPFRAIELSLTSQAVMVMAHRERRPGRGNKVLIPWEQLCRGDPVYFKVDYPRDAPPTFRTGYIDHEIRFGVHVAVPWGTSDGFERAVHVLPRGSRAYAAEDRSPILLGAGRLARIAEEMAAATGLARGQLPTLIEGKIGAIRVRVTDGPKKGRVGLYVDFGLPDLDLGIVYRPQGTFERLKTSSLLPPNLHGDSMRLEVGQDLLAIPPPTASLAAFFAAILGDLPSGSELRIDDHHLGFHVVLATDNVEDLVRAAELTKERAEVLTSAIRALPFAAVQPDAEAAWRATAKEENAFLLPHVPALVDIVVRTRILGGELREVGVALRTRSDRTINADLDLRLAPLPQAAMAELPQGTPEGLRPVRAVFPRCRVHSAEKVTLEGAPFAADPRSLLSVLDVFLTWLVDVRGERRTESAYR